MERIGTFVLERDLDAPPEAVYAVFVEPERRRRWIRLPGTADPTSQVTAVLTPAGPGTHLTWTEQYTFLRLNGPDDLAHLRGGAELHLNGLAVALT